MEALLKDFSLDYKIKDISDDASKKSSCWILIDPNSDKKITNNDIVICINDHHRALDEDHEAGVKINHLGKDIVFYIDHIAHQNQSMIYFKGHTENGKLVHFVKHSSELKIGLHPLKRRQKDTPKVPFGFDSWATFDELKLQYAS